jgi:tetratricopeptide (TPR) repeat protein
MQSFNIWLPVFVIAWIWCVVSFVIYAYYRGWIEYGFLATLEKRRLYRLLRLARTSALLFISVSVIAFIYFETDIFPKRILAVDVRITSGQYENYLKQRYGSIERQLTHADASRKKLLEQEKSDIENRLRNFPADYGRYIGWVRAQISRLRLSRLQESVPASLLSRGIEAFADGDMIASDLVLEQIENVPDIPGTDVAMLAFMRGSLARWSVNPAQAYQHYARAARLAPGDRKSLEQAGYMAYVTGEYKASATYYESVLALDLAKYGETHPSVANDYNNLGRTWRELDLPTGYEYFERALSTGLAIYPEDHPFIEWHSSNLGWVLMQMNEHRRAIPHFERALAINLKRHGKDSRDAMKSYGYLGWAWKKLGDHRRAVKLYENALAISLKLHGVDHIDTADYQEDLALSWAELAQYDKSIAYYEQALATYRKHYDKDHAAVVRARTNLKGMRQWLKGSQGAR